LFDPQLAKEERMRGQTVGRLPSLFIASVLALATFAASAWSQAPLDRQSLVGGGAGRGQTKACHISTVSII